MSYIERAEQMVELHERIAGDRLYPRPAFSGLVGGIGSYRPEAMIVGSCPGMAENTAHRPLQGPGGVLLLQLMELAGLRVGPVDGSRGWRGIKNAWFTYAVKYRSPTPASPPTAGAEIVARPYLREEWEILGRPRLIITVGSTPWNIMSPFALSGGIAQWAGHPICLKDGKTYLYPTFDPLMGNIPGERQQAVRDKLERDWDSMREKLGEQGYAR